LVQGDGRFPFLRRALEVWFVVFVLLHVVPVVIITVCELILGFSQAPRQSMRWANRSASRLSDALGKVGDDGFFHELAEGDEFQPIFQQFLDVEVLKQIRLRCPTHRKLPE
jgi:hypothetical protein